MIKDDEVQRLMDSASRSIGTPALEEERAAIRDGASEALRVRGAIREIDKVIVVAGASAVWFAAQSRRTISEYRPDSETHPAPPPYSEFPPPSSADAAAPQ